MSLLGRSMGTRVTVLPLQVAATALVTFLTIRTIGVEAYATVGLLVGLQGLFGFLNLGTSAAVSNAAGESLALGIEHLIRVSVTAARLTLLAGGVLVPLSGFVALLGWWPHILGRGDPKLLTLGALVAIVAVALLQPLSQGGSILMATGRTVLATWLNVAPSLVALVLVLGATLRHSSPILFVVFPYLAQVVVAMVGCIIAGRKVGFSLRTFMGLVIHRGFRGARIKYEARPALVMWVLLPLAYQTDRLLISHLSSSSQLASYNLAAQSFAALFSIVAVGSASLWGHYAKARVTASLPGVRAFSRLSLGFAGLGAILGIGYVIATPLAASLLSDGKVTVSALTLVSFGALLIVQSFHQPSAMLQTDRSGLWFNAGAVMAMTVLNLGLGMILTRPLGAAGPVLASVVALTFGLALPSFVRARWTLVHEHQPFSDLS
jgi:hypothetical protein